MKELQISACFRIMKVLLIRVQPQGQTSMGYTTNMLFSEPQIPYISHPALNLLGLHHEAVL